MFYISLYNVAAEATDDDIYAAFPEAYINNVFPIEGVDGAFDLQFKDRNEVIKAIDCRDDCIKGQKFDIRLSGLTRQPTQGFEP